METITNLAEQLRAYYLAHYWYHGLAWLVLWYFVIIWPLAAVCARLIFAMNQRRESWEHAAYLGWAIAFAAHIVLWIIHGLDSLPLTWHWGAPGDPGFWSPVTGLQYVAATVAILPYIVMLLLDLWLCVRLAQRSSKANT